MQNPPSFVAKILPLPGALALLTALVACGSSESDPTAVKPATPLNDTGTSFCRDLTGASVTCSTAPIQDGNTGRDARTLNKQGGGTNGLDLTKLDANGGLLARQYAPWNSAANNIPWHCVRDNHTGLVWETKSSTPGSFNHKDHLYQWHNPVAATDGGVAGDPGREMCGSALCDTAAYVTALNAARWCGSDQWRLPTVTELLSLVVTDNLGLAFDPEYFPDAQPSHYWTSESYAPDQTKAWYLYLSDGSVASTLKSKPMYLRLVYRPGQPNEGTP